jgi:hypothetical protein
VVVGDLAEDGDLVLVAEGVDDIVLPGLEPLEDALGQVARPVVGAELPSGGDERVAAHLQAAAFDFLADDVGERVEGEALALEEFRGRAFSAAFLPVRPMIMVGVIAIRRLKWEAFGTLERYYI